MRVTLSVSDPQSDMAIARRGPRQMANISFSIARHLLLLLALAASSFAQVNTGRISGTITDSSGAVVPGAKVTVTNEATGIVRSVLTNPDGFYVAPNLPVGSFTVEAEAAGFQKSVQKNNEVPAAGKLTLDFTLRVGAATESVTVTATAGAETVNTVSGELAYTVDSDQVKDLALNGRNYLELVTLMPGVAVLNLDQMATTTSFNTNYQSVNGGRVEANHLAVDGTSNLDSGSNTSQLNNVSVDAIEQVRMMTSAFSAEHGRNSGANINVITKSGGEKYHGAAFYTHRNDAFDARDGCLPPTAAKQKLRFNDWGWNLNGPVPGLPKHRVFFMFNMEWKKIRQTQGPTRRTLPTRAETTGDFSDRPTWILLDPTTRLPIPNNNITSMMTPDGKALMALYTKAMSLAGVFNDTPTANNAVFQMEAPFNWRQEIGKVDYRVNDRHSLYFKLMHDSYLAYAPYGSFINSQLPLTPTSRVRPTWAPQLSLTSTLNPRLVNEAKISAAWHGQRTPLEGDLWKRSTYGFQFGRVYNGANGPYPEGIPGFGLTGTGSGFADVNSPSGYLVAPTTDISFTDNVSYILSNHTIRTGLLIVRNRKDQNSQANYLGDIAFNPSGNAISTGYAIADAALGNFSNYQEQNGDPTGYFRFSEYTGYAQDNWRVSRTFNVEIGLRYTWFVPTYSVPNNLSNFVPSAWDPAQAVKLNRNGTLVPGVGNPLNGFVLPAGGVPEEWISRIPGASSPEYASMPKTGPRGLYPPSNTWAPRFSFAWTPFGGKTAIRGGFGVFHDRTPAALVLYGNRNKPFAASVSYNFGNLSSVTGGTSPAAGAQGRVYSTDPQLGVPVLYKFNLGFQRELPWSMMFEASVVSEQGRHGVRAPNINMYSLASEMANNALPAAVRLNLNNLRPYAGLTTLTYFMSDSNSNYNGLQLRGTKRRGNAMFVVNYTWSKALADVRSNFLDGGDPYLPLDRHYNYGPTNNDRRHLFVASYTYRLPTLRRSHQFVRTTLGGWSFSGITRLQTGQLLTVVGTSTNAQQARRASYLGGDTSLPSDQRSRDKWFNTAAFARPPPTASATPASAPSSAPAGKSGTSPSARNSPSTKTSGSAFEPTPSTCSTTPTSTTPTSASTPTPASAPSTAANPRAKSSSASTSPSDLLYPWTAPPRPPIPERSDGPPPPIPERSDGPPPASPGTK